MKIKVKKEEAEKIIATLTEAIKNHASKEKTNFSEFIWSFFNFECPWDSLGWKEGQKEIMNLEISKILYDWGYKESTQGFMVIEDNNQNTIVIFAIDNGEGDYDVYKYTPTEEEVYDIEAMIDAIEIEEQNLIEVEI